MKDYKGKGPRGITARQLSIIVLMALVAAAVLAINVSSDYTGETPGRVVVNAFLKDPDADKPETGNSVLEQEDYENGKIEAALLSKAHVIENCTVTWYTNDTCGKKPGDPSYGITASGEPTYTHCTVATDPGVIPMYSDVCVQYSDGTTEWYKATDTGVTGSHVDIYTDDYDYAIQMGKQALTVCFIPPVEVDVD